MARLEGDTGFVIAAVSTVQVESLFPGVGRAIFSHQRKHVTAVKTQIRRCYGASLLSDAVSVTATSSENS